MKNDSVVVRKSSTQHSTFTGDITEKVTDSVVMAAVRHDCPLLLLVQHLQKIGGEGGVDHLITCGKHLQVKSRDLQPRSSWKCLVFRVLLLPGSKYAVSSAKLLVVVIFLCGFCLIRWFLEGDDQGIWGSG